MVGIFLFAGIAQKVPDQQAGGATGRHLQRLDRTENLVRINDRLLSTPRPLLLCKSSRARAASAPVKVRGRFQAHCQLFESTLRRNLGDNNLAELPPGIFDPLTALEDLCVATDV